MDDRVASAALALFPMSTLAVLPGGFERFTFPKLLVVSIALVCAFCVPRSASFPPTVTGLAALVVAVFTVAALAGESPVAALLGRWPRYEGLPVLLVYGGSAVAGARLLGGRDAAHISRFLGACRVVAVALFVTSTMDAAGHPLLGASDVTRPGALLGNATDLGIVAAMIFAVLLAAYVDDRRMWTALPVAAALATVALSGSRAALAGAALILVATAVVLGRRATRVVVLALVTLGLAALAIPQTRDRLTAGHTVTGRRLLWEDSWELAREHLALGVGPNRFVDAIGTHHGTAWIRQVGYQNPPDAPHNWIIQSLTVGGLPMLLACMALATTVLILGIRRRLHTPDALTAGSLIAVIGYGAMLLTHFTTAGTTCLAAFLCGALVGIPRPSVEPIWRRVGAIGLASLAIAALLAATVAEIPLQHGIQRVADGSLEQANSSFGAAHRLRPWDSDIGMLASQAYAQPASDGDLLSAELAVRWATRSLDRTPQSYDALLARGVGLIALGKLNAAETDLDLAIAVGPTDPRAWLQRGIARFGQQDANGALDDVERATRLDPEDPVSKRVLDEMRSQIG
ncbi:MAG: hypothetical protein JWR83_2284 [Aeromicrobium sp.]|nr:hypothetical protein [Aeromicrobium sp.]